MSEPCLTFADHLYGSHAHKALEPVEIVRIQVVLCGLIDKKKLLPPGNPQWRQSVEFRQMP
jgi:hypothetical protein